MSINKSIIADSIKNYLLTNGFKPGDRIPVQTELLSALNISARQFRDGINILISQGFLIPKGRAGTFLTNPNQNDVVEPIRWFYEVKDVSGYDLIKAREILEKALIVEACNSRTTKDLLYLQQIVDKQMSDSISLEEDFELDKQFHLKLVECAHNKALDIVGNVILLQLDLVLERGLYPVNDYKRREDHQKIIDALFNRNIDLSVNLISSHIERCCSVANNNQVNPLEE